MRTLNYITFIILGLALVAEFVLYFLKGDPFDWSSLWLFVGFGTYLELRFSIDRLENIEQNAYVGEEEIVSIYNLQDELICSCGWDAIVDVGDVMIIGGKEYQVVGCKSTVNLDENSHEVKIFVD